MLFRSGEKVAELHRRRRGLRVEGRGAFGLKDLRAAPAGFGPEAPVGRHRVASQLQRLGDQLSVGEAAEVAVAGPLPFSRLLVLHPDRQAGEDAENNPDKVLASWGSPRLIASVEGVRFYGI